jgi:PD-(D/E)XK nuclease superfamily
LLEIKAVDKLLPIRDAQILTYLRLSHKSGLADEF